MDIIPALLLFILYIAVVVAIFLITRAIWLWYFRVNEIVDALQASATALRNMASTLDKLQSTLSETRGNVRSINPEVGKISKTEFGAGYTPANASKSLSWEEAPDHRVHSFPSDTEGFMLGKWGIPLSQYIDRLIPIANAQENQHYATFSCPPEDLNLDGIVLENIELGFIDDCYHWAVATVSTEKGKNVTDALTKLYGNPDYEVNNVKFWLGKTTFIAWREFSLKSRLPLCIMSREAFLDKQLNIVWKNIGIPYDGPAV